MRGDLQSAPSSTFSITGRSLAWEEFRPMFYKSRSKAPFSSPRLRLSRELLTAESGGIAW